MIGDKKAARIKRHNSKYQKLINDKGFMQAAEVYPGRAIFILMLSQILDRLNDIEAKARNKIQ
jgi:hypothetical protein